MATIVDILLADTIPPSNRILKAQGVPVDPVTGPQYAEIVQDAISRYRNLASPRGLFLEISQSDFEGIYRGEGSNAVRTPLEYISQQAQYLSLFAVTIGDLISREISGLFAANDFARAAMLDAAASEGTEIAADVLESNVRERLRQSGRLGSDAGLVRFSPGYCGWNTSGQRKLFEYLRPEEIGIELGDSCLMQPLKSISGVFVGGPKEIFVFEEDFPFCADCDTHSCRERAAALSPAQNVKTKKGV